MKINGQRGPILVTCLVAGWRTQFHGSSVRSLFLIFLFLPFSFTLKLHHLFFSLAPRGFDMRLESIYSPSLFEKAHVFALYIRFAKARRRFGRSLMNMLCTMRHPGSAVPCGERFPL